MEVFESEHETIIRMLESINRNIGSLHEEVEELKGQTRRIRQTRRQSRLASRTPSRRNWTSTRRFLIGNVRITRCRLSLARQLGKVKRNLDGNF